MHKSSQQNDIDGDHSISSNPTIDQVNAPSIFNIIQEVTHSTMCFNIDYLNQFEQYRIMWPKPKIFDGFYVRKGDLIAESGYRDEKSNQSATKTTPIYAHDSGYLSYATDDMVFRTFNWTSSSYEICHIYHSLDDLLQERYPIEYEISTDDFTKEKVFKWKKVTNENDGRKLTISYGPNLGFDYCGKIPCLLIETPRIGISLSILYNNDEVVSIPLVDAKRQRPYFILPMTKRIFEAITRNDIKKMRFDFGEDVKYDFSVSEPHNYINSLVFRCLADVLSLPLKNMALNGNPKWNHFPNRAKKVQLHHQMVHAMYT